MPDDSGKEPKTMRRTLGGFEIVEKLGQGAMGAVFKARQVSVDRTVALKVLPRKYGKDERFVTRFLREAQSAARLDHPHVVGAIDAGKADGYYYFAMEFVQGTTLGDLIRSEGKLPERRALEIARQVASALACAHEAGIIHRDVKPDNVLITADGNAKLADLGLARKTEPGDSSVTIAGTTLGTPYYISPEQVRGETDLDGRTDIYSLGATLYHMLTGAPPYAGNTSAETMAEHLTQPIPDLLATEPGLSRRTADIIRKAMAKDRVDRYADAQRMMDALDHALEGVGTARPRPAPGTPRRRRWSTRNKAICAAGAALVIAGLALLLWPEGPTDTPPDDPAAAPAADERPEPGPSRREQDLERFAQAQAWEREHPDDLPGAVARYQAALKQIRDPDVTRRAKDAIYRLNVRFAQAADAAFDRLEEQANAALASGDYNAALDVYADPPDRFRDALAEWLAEATAAVHRRARQKIDERIDEANRLAEAGRPERAIRILDELEAMPYRGLPRDRLAERRQTFLARSKNVDEMERRRALDRAEQELARLLDRIEAAVANGDLAKAAALGKPAATDEALRPAAELADAVAAVARLIPAIPRKRRAAAPDTFKAHGRRVVSLDLRDGTRVSGKIKAVTDDGLILEKTALEDGTVRRVELAVGFADLADKTLVRFNVPWKPANAHEAIAGAVFALAREEPQRMEELLADATTHRLHPRYEQKLDELKSGPLEAAARACWETHIEPLARAERLDRERAKAAEQTLARFEKEHGKTEFARSAAGRIAALRRKIVAGLGGAELIRVRKLFRGEVAAFDPATREIALAYDFSEADQLADWERSRWPKGERGRVVVHKGALHLSNTSKQLLLKPRFTSVSISADFAVDGGSHGATLVACSDGGGNHYELVGIWRTEDKAEPLWRCHLSKYKDGRFADDHEVWPIKPTPFAGTRHGRFRLACEAGRVWGEVGSVSFSAEDEDHRRGRAGLWASGTKHAAFDNVQVRGRLDREWLEEAFERAGLGERPRPRPP